MLGGGVADALPSVHDVAQLALGSERALVIAAIAVAPVAIERDAGPLSRPAAGSRVTALARDVLVLAGEGKAGLGVIDRSVGVRARDGEQQAESDEEPGAHLDGGQWSCSSSCGSPCRVAEPRPEPHRPR